MLSLKVILSNFFAVFSEKFPFHHHQSILVTFPLSHVSLLKTKAVLQNWCYAMLKTFGLASFTDALSRTESHIHFDNLCANVQGCVFACFLDVRNATLFFCTLTGIFPLWNCDTYFPFQEKTFEQKVMTWHSKTCFFFVVVGRLHLGFSPFLIFYICM